MCQINEDNAFRIYTSSVQSFGVITINRRTYTHGFSIDSRNKLCSAHKRCLSSLNVDKHKFIAVGSYTLCMRSNNHIHINLHLTTYSVANLFLSLSFTHSFS